MKQVPREAQSIWGLMNLDSVPLNVIVSKHFNERSFHHRKKWQTTLVNNLPWQIIFKPPIWTVILLSIIICFVNRNAYPNSRAFCCWWKCENVGQRERVTSLPFWKSVVSSYSDKTACVSIDPSLAPPQQRGRTALKINPPALKVSPILGGLCSATQLETSGAPLENETGTEALRTHPAIARSAAMAACLPHVLSPPCCNACNVGWHLRVASEYFHFAARSELPPFFFSEPDGDAFGFSFNHVTFARRIKWAGTAIGRSNIRKPCFARGNHIKACVCVWGEGAARDDAWSFLHSELRFVSETWWNHPLDKSHEPVNLTRWDYL